MTGAAASRLSPQQAVDLLAQAGSDKTKLLSATIYLPDIATFAEMNSVWDGWVAKGHTPARATVEAKLAAPKYTVEIACIAAKARRRPPCRAPPPLS